MAGSARVVILPAIRDRVRALVLVPAQRAAAALNQTLGGDLADPLTPITMPALFPEMVAAAYDLPAERCVDDCLTLAYAYAQLGMAAGVRTTELRAYASRRNPLWRRPGWPQR